MKNNYKFNFNSKKLSSNEVAKHKDFEALLHKAQQSTSTDEAAQTSISTSKQDASIRPLRWIVAAVAAALIGAIFYFGLSSNGDTLQTSGDDYFAALPFVNPPLPDAQADFNSVTVNANEGGVYEFENGSRLVVPKAAFMDDRGKLISGEVEVKYREYHDFVDFFLSGIPMAYDSSGVKYNLESAGMMEIYAEQNGTRLDMNPEKAIDVELVSEINVKENENPQYNIYKLDTAGRNWVYQGLDNIEMMETIADAQFTDADLSPEEELTSEIATLENKQQQELAAVEASIPRPAAPKRPEKADENAVTFEMDFGAVRVGSNSIINNSDIDIEQEQAAIKQTDREIDQLRAQWEGTIWQVKAGQEQLLDETFANTIWDEDKSQLNPINDRDFEIVLTNGSIEKKLIVNPVLSPSDYNNALAEFNRQFDTYQSQLADRQQLLDDQKQNIEARFEEEKALFNQKYEDRIAMYKAKGLEDRATDALIRQKIVNRFRVTSFGIWNCDRPLPPYTYRLESEFVDNQSKAIKGQPAYLVSKNTNTIFRFFTQPGTEVRFNSNQENMIWTITKDNQLAIFEPEKFAAITDNTGEYTFQMDRRTIDVSDEEALRDVLNFD